MHSSELFRLFLLPTVLADLSVTGGSNKKMLPNETMRDSIPNARSKKVSKSS
jgi:hypothetical protein